MMSLLPVQKYSRSRIFSGVTSSPTRMLVGTPVWNVHTGCNWRTLAAVIWLSGEKRVPALSRPYSVQS